MIYATAVPAAMHTRVHIHNEFGLIEELNGPSLVFDMVVNKRNRHFILATLSGALWALDFNKGNAAQQFGIVNGLTSIALSDDGMTLLLGNSAGLVAVWRQVSPYRYTEANEYKIHAGPVTCLAFENDMALSGGTDQLIYRWNISDGQIAQCCEGHRSQITALIPFADSVCLSAGGINDFTVCLWNLEYGSLIHALPRFPCQIGALAAHKKTFTAFVGLQNGDVACWDMAKRELIANVQLRSAAVTRMVYSAPDDLVLIGRENGAVDQITAAYPLSAGYLMKGPGSITALAALTDAYSPKSGPETSQI